MAGGHQALLLYRASAPALPFFGDVAAYVDAHRAGGTAVAAAIFKTDGTCEGDCVTDTLTDTLTGSRWAPVAPSPGIGSSYWFLVTHTGGSALSFNGASVWTQGLADISFSISQNVFGAKVSSARVDISLSSGGAIVATGAVNLEVTRT